MLYRIDMGIAGATAKPGKERGELFLWSFRPDFHVAIVRVPYPSGKTKPLCFLYGGITEANALHLSTDPCGKGLIRHSPPTFLRLYRLNFMVSSDEPLRVKPKYSSRLVRSLNTR